MFCDYCGDLLTTRGYLKYQNTTFCFKPECVQRAKDEGEAGLLVLMGQLFGPQEGGDGKEDKVDADSGNSVPGNGGNNLYQTLGRRYEDGT